MKKALLLLLLALPFFVQAQLEMDDFETYTVGSFDEQWDATQWVGWFGGASGTEISDEQASSGTHSLKVTDNPTADDLVALLPTLNSGIYELSMMQYIPATDGAYLNLQHAYTNTAGDWAAEIYFTNGVLGAGQINTDGENFTFPIVHDAWASLRFVLNFLTEEAEFYYNDQLIITWVLSTNAGGGAGLNQINAINFFAACGDDGNGCTSAAYYDDMLLTEIPLPDFDLSFSAIANPFEYVNIPVTQAQEINLEAEIINQGGMDVSNVEVVANVMQGGSVVFTESLGMIASLPSGGTATLNSPSTTFTPSAVGDYTIEYVANLSETDLEMSNNVGSFSFAVSDSLYSRDDGNYIDGIGVQGQTALLGQAFDIVETDVVTAIRVTYAGGAVGETIQGSILTEQGGTPLDLIAATDLHTIETVGALGAEITVDLTFIAPVTIQPGRYIFMVEQQGTTSLVLSVSESIFTPNSTLASADQGSTWGTLESFGLPFSMAIRPILGDVMVSVNEPIFAPSMKLTPNLTDAKTMLSLDLDAPQDLTIEIFNINGQRVENYQFNKASGLVKQELDLSNQASGTYFVTVTSEGKRASRKVQVVK